MISLNLKLNGKLYWKDDQKLENLALTVEFERRQALALTGTRFRANFRLTQSFLYF